jgi:hypothetical protein
MLLACEKRFSRFSADPQGEKMKQLWPITVLLLAIGCGGGGGGSTGTTGGSPNPADGTVTFNVDWARTASRVIPLASESIALTLADSLGHTVATGSIVKPATTWTSAELPPGRYTFAALAYPSSSESGVIQATGTGSVDVTNNINATPVLTMASTVASVTVTAPSSTLYLGTPVQLTASASDAYGKQVVIDPSSLTWALSDSAIAGVSANGLVTPAAIGACNVTVTFNEIEPTLGQIPISSAPVNLTVNGGTTTIGIH